ncbi:pentatricopeptide repeat-containing protein At3g22670, mitochondrial-like [Zingiber officinale]|nr:pentatricopeptide repeat-containing protein At3g22670, mitochondrial-like [Zingiber officinale]
MTKLMRRLAGADRCGDAIKTFKSIESFGVRKDTISINALLDTLCKEKSVKHARDAFLELRDEVQPNASSFNILIHGWSKARKIEEDIRIIEEMREFGYTPCVITFTSLVEGYCLEKNFRMASAILNEMRGHGCQPNVVTYTIIMHSLAKAKEIQEALLVFEMMKDAGCAPDTSFYNSLIFLMGKSGKLRDAHHIFE